MGTFALLMLALSTAWAGPARLTTTDGVTVRGTELGSGAKGVLLVHAQTRTSEDWAYIAGKLADRGFRVLSIDLRGHGASVPPDAVADDEWTALVHDVDAGIAWLSARGASEITVVGAEIGANLAVNAASDQPTVTNLVLVSPGMNLDGVMVKQPLLDYGDRPVLIIASNEDAYAAKTARFLSALATGPKYLEIVETGSGTRMINRDIDLETLLLDWIDGGWRERAAGADGERNLETGTTEEIETSGVKFGG